MGSRRRSFVFPTIRRPFTGFWWWFVEKARELGHEVCLSHPKQTKAIAHARLKSDKVDAVVVQFNLT